MSRKWADPKRKRGLDVAPALHAPILMVETEKDGERWLFRIPKWGLLGQAESVDGVEAATRDLIAQSVGIAIVSGAYAAADEAEREPD